MATGELPVSENGLVVEIKYSQVQTKKKQCSRWGNPGPNNLVRRFLGGPPKITALRKKKECCKTQ